MNKKMHDLKGTLNKTNQPCEVSKIWYPTVRVTGKQLPELEGCSIGDKVTLSIDCEIKSMDKRNNDPIDYSLDIKKAGVSKWTSKHKSKLDNELY